MNFKWRLPLSLKRGINDKFEEYMMLILIKAVDSLDHNTIGLL